MTVSGSPAQFIEPGQGFLFPAHVSFPRNKMWSFRVVFRFRPNERRGRTFSPTLSCRLLSAWLKLRCQESMDARRDSAVLLSPTPLFYYGSNKFPTGQTPGISSARQSSALSLGWCPCYSETPDDTVSGPLLYAGAAPFIQQQEGGEENAPAAEGILDGSCPEDAYHSGSRIEGVDQAAKARDILRRTPESSAGSFGGPSTKRSLGNPAKLSNSDPPRKAGGQKGGNESAFFLTLEEQEEGKQKQKQAESGRFRRI